MRNVSGIGAVAALALVLVLAAGVAAGGPDGEAGGWLPLAEGRKWTYRVEKIATVAGFSKRKDVGKATCVVKGKEKIGDLDVWVLDWTVEEEDYVRARQWVRASPTAIEVAKTSPGNDLFVVPADFEKRRARAQVKGEAGEAITVESRHGAEEEIETPAGKFKAIAITNEADVGGGIQAVRTVWYAKDVGIVKIVKKASVGMGIVADKEYLLTAFEVGGAK